MVFSSYLGESTIIKSSLSHLAYLQALFEHLMSLVSSSNTMLPIILSNIF